MTIIKLNKRAYTHAMHGKGIHGKYSKVRMQQGYGIFDTLGKTASKHVLGGLGKTTGNYYGKQLGKLIGDKTGSKLLGSVAKSGLSALGSFAGDRLGSTVGKVIGNNVFSDAEKEKKDKKKQEKVSLNDLLDNARKRITGSGMQYGQGISLNY